MANAAAELPAATAAPAVANGAKDFDFQVGEWRVHHRVKSASEKGGWLEFDGACNMRTLMGGRANVEEHTFNKTSGVAYGVALRAYDEKTAQWAIWWVDSRDPHGALDPPVKGRFEKGVGTFYADYVVKGRPMRARYIWSHITATTAHWEQASTDDGGKTWDTNWLMEFKRVS